MKLSGTDIMAHVQRAWTKQVAVHPVHARACVLLLQNLDFADGLPSCGLPVYVLLPLPERLR